MKTLADEWKEFLRRVYPEGAAPEQERQVRVAFYAGAAVALCMTAETAEGMPEEEGAARLAALFNEARAFTAQQAVERYLRGERPGKNPGPPQGERN